MSAWDKRRELKAEEEPAPSGQKERKTGRRSWSRADVSSERSVGEEEEEEEEEKEVTTG